MIFALALPVVAILTGSAIDLHRAANAKASSQIAVDAAALAAASSRERSNGRLYDIADAYLDRNLDRRYLNENIHATVERPSDPEIKVSLRASVEPIFMGLIGVRELPVVVSATAVRGTSEQVEVALVLDNTWSMSDVDAGGARKIDSLKSAATQLVNEVMQDSDGKVRVGVVPYADYVNVGMSNRSRSWLSVPADYSTTSQRTCSTQTTRQQCTRGTPKTCTRQVDGVSETYDCTPSTCSTVTVAPYEQCSGGGTTNYRWYGCVGSRTQGSLRLNDSQADRPYPGFLATGQNCLNPIVDLTDQRSSIVSTIQNLIVNVGGYKPLTYIPSGLIWGVNLLSPTEPFNSAAAYSQGNRTPRKILVLMTDGANTLRFNPSTGRHEVFSTNGNTAEVQLRATNSDTLAICDYAKSKHIEVFTVAFAVASNSARDMLQSCATDSDHYFDARDASALAESFAEIAASINRVRLVR